MSAQSTDVQSAQNKAPKLSDELNDLKPELEKVLPAHVTPEKFMRVVMTAIAQSPDLRTADRRSLLTSCVKAAQDGLLPDGREAALVIFNTKEKITENGRQVDHWIKKVQYMPMVGGILKKVRNSGELLSITSNVVYEQDTFRYWMDDSGEHVLFEPNLKIADRGKMLAVYALAKTKDGGVYIEVMSRGQVEQVRNVSKSKDSGPWGTWYDEMSRKTVIRRLSKRLPMSTDLEAVVHRDDELYDLNQQRLAATSGTSAAKAVLGLPILPDADDAAAAGAGVDTQTGEVIEGAQTAKIDAPTEAASLRACKSYKELLKTWTEIKKILGDDEVPLDVSAAYTEMCDHFDANKKE